MDYKKIIKSRAVRESIMRLLSFVPDKEMVRLQYWIKTGRRLNLEDPKRFTEKLQWYKLYYRDPLMAQCADKYDVRQYVADCGFSEILVPLVGIYNSPEQINWEELPNRFVAKDTLGGGGNSVIIVKDKKLCDCEEVFAQMQKWVNTPTNCKHPGREWVYDGKKHRIIIEEYIESDPQQGGLIDYKFFCFNGKPEYIYVVADRTLGKEAGLGIFTTDYERVSAIRCDEKPLMRDIAKPANFESLLIVAEKLAHNFPEARIDLYNQNNKILFGEITFFDGSGYMQFEPDEFDYRVGEVFILPN